MMTPTSVVPRRSSDRSRDCALGDPRHDVLGVDHIDDILAAFIAERQVVGPYFLEQMRRHERSVRRNVRIIQQMQRVLIVHRHPNLKPVIRRFGMRVAIGQNTRENDRVTYLPIVDVFALAFEQTPFVNTVLKLGEINLFMVGARSPPARRWSP